MQEALHILRFAPCYHMFVAKEMGHAGLWLEAEEAVREGKAFDFSRYVPFWFPAVLPSLRGTFFLFVSQATHRFDLYRSRRKLARMETCTIALLTC